MASRSAGTISGLPALGTQQWDDLHFRHNFSDTGRYPTPGVLSASPDIVPLGGNPVSDAQYLIDGVNWRTDFGGATYASEPNYIYLRGENLAAARATGRLYLYHAPASLLLWPTDPLDPSQGWAKRPLRTDRGDQWVEVSAAPGQRFCTREPFRWNPQPGSKQHYALIARIETERHPNPIPETGTITDFAAYLSQHPDLAWRNVTTVNPGPVMTSTVSYQQGSAAGVIYLCLVCTYVPDGSAVSFSSGTPGPSPIINLKKTAVRNYADPDGVPRFDAILRTRIPAGWSSEISFTWYSEGKTPLPGMCLRFEAIMPVEPDDPLLGAAAAPLADFGIPDGQRGQRPRRGIRLGSATMCTPRAAAPG
jgi:hypothetical protein